MTAGIWIGCVASGVRAAAPQRAAAHCTSVTHNTSCHAFQNVFATNAELSGQIIQHYTLQGLAEVYKVPRMLLVRGCSPPQLFGCMEFLGNPVKLFGHLSDGATTTTIAPRVIDAGVTDMFYEPFLADDIVGFGGAFLTGIHSLTSNTIGTCRSSNACHHRAQRVHRAPCPRSPAVWATALRCSAWTMPSRHPRQCIPPLHSCAGRHSDGAQHCRAARPCRPWATAARCWPR